jgi:sRNA-binding regulator protein Hfq
LKPAVSKPVASKGPAPSKSKSKPTEQTFQEPKYLRYLIEKEIPVTVKLTDNEQVSGVVEFYDQNFIRITREDGPNLFIFKHDIKYLYERG